MHNTLKQENHAAAERETVLKMLAEKKNIIQSFGVRKIVLTQVRNWNTPDAPREIDVRVDFQDMSLDIYLDLKNYLESLFNARVELIIEGSLKAKMR
ncbi:MAG: hypothetical protein HZA02_01155 [Nitrospinae bacterium]|nr:hypothetical protein [Nitrospinota bacterium]